jgi:hypothetical protein
VALRCVSPCHCYHRLAICYRRGFHAATTSIVVKLTNATPLVRFLVPPPSPQDYETPLHPTGLLLRLAIHSSWGDAYYVGLEGLQVYDLRGDEVEVDADKVRHPGRRGCQLGALTQFGAVVDHLS